MNETTFENAKVGDRVWSLPHGWGTVRRIEANLLQVEFRHSTWWYHLSGACLENYPQTLFWDEIKFEAPPRPKRKAKKVVAGWVNIYSGRCGSIYDTPAEARRNRDADCLGEPLLIKHEYEVEE